MKVIISCLFFIMVMAGFRSQAAVHVEYQTSLYHGLTNFAIALTAELEKALQKIKSIKNIQLDKPLQIF